jgi:hypothetical protein
MPKYLFTTQRVTNYEDTILADTEEKAIEFYMELITDDFTEVSQHISWEVAKENNNERYWKDKQEEEYDQEEPIKKR